MNESNFQFASDLVEKTLAQNSNFESHPDIAVKVQTLRCGNSASTLDLTPFIATAKPVSAMSYFEKIETPDDLIAGYTKARKSCSFEIDLPSVSSQVNTYSTEFIENIVQSATKLSDFQIKLIADFVKNLDIYAAIKSIESLLNSRADIALLEVAHAKDWHVHFDHLAIRCGSEKNNDAKYIANFLIREHEYVPSQVKEEAHYQFPDGWNAYPLYKILENGQVIRVFVDQSDATDKKQIIQHWNRVYGYTAHHLALRATEIHNGEKREIPLPQIMEALQAHGITILQPTGEQTHGLLLQVFTKPELNEFIPDDILEDLREKGSNLENTIKNGKLLEVVSRKEMTMDMSIKLFELYDLKYDVNNPLHSAPIYTYFLPAQAAHVIKTSQETEK